jgi:hypothetical protein
LFRAGGCDLVHSSACLDVRDELGEHGSGLFGHGDARSPTIPITAAAAPLRSASLRTSAATTAKPLPCSPPGGLDGRVQAIGSSPGNFLYDGDLLGDNFHAVTALTRLAPVPHRGGLERDLTRLLGVVRVLRHWRPSVPWEEEISSTSRGLFAAPWERSLRRGRQLPRWPEATFPCRLHLGHHLTQLVDHVVEAWQDADLVLLVDVRLW